MTSTPTLECIRCGGPSRSIMLPTGPLCTRCRRHLAYHPADCPGCDQVRPLAYPSPRDPEVLVCAACAGQTSVFACRSCGREDHPYGGDTCARCILTTRLNALLQDPATGSVHTGLRPLYDELVDAPRPQSVITWLRKPPGTRSALLARMAQGLMPISHEAFRALPADRTHNYLRELLASVGALPAYDPALERIDRWLEAKLALLDADSSALIARYARWHVLRQVRRGAGVDPITKGATDGARGQIAGAIRLAHWAGAHGCTLDQITQSSLEQYLDEYPGARTSQYGFITWLSRSGTNARISLLPAPSSLPEVVVSDEERWANINMLLHDDTIRLYARIGGLLMLLFAQPLTSICAMTVRQVTQTTNNSISVTFEATPVQMPPVLDALIHEHLARPGTPSILNQEHGWLFPGRNPGRHLTSENFRRELVAHGIHPGQSRHAALFGLAAALPAPVLADLIGIADVTAGRWAALAARDWSSYIRMRADT